MRNFLLLLIVAAAFIPSCNFFRGERVRGNGHQTTEERAVGSFKSVSSSGSFDIYVSSAATPAVKIEAEENLLPYIETYVDGDKLYIDTKDGYWLDNKRAMRVFVSAPEFTSIHSSGSGNIIGETKITNPHKLALSVSGSADIKMEVDAPEVEAEVSGSGDIRLQGQTKIFKTGVSGSGDIHAMDLLAEETSVQITGSGDADVYASVALDVAVTGSGDVRYKGGGQLRKSNIAGSGKVTKLE